MNGELHRADDHYAVRFVRRLPHPPEKVWRAVTEPEHLAAWYPTSIEGDRAVGARLAFRFPGEADPVEEGRMLAYDPPRLLEFTQGGDTIRIELRPDGDGTEFVFTNLFTELGKAARDTAGWHVCVDGLAAHLDGVPPAEDPHGQWEPLFAHYSAAFGPESATIGPPEGYGPEDA
jgi:uncharacterized protein YndB with AHSA1/START domain